jgi:hypothetical protein
MAVFNSPTCKNLEIHLLDSDPAYHWEIVHDQNWVFHKCNELLFNLVPRKFLDALHGRVSQQEDSSRGQCGSRCSPM